MEDNLTQSFNQLGSQIRENIPPIKVGGNNATDDPITIKIKRWLLIGLSALVGGGAAILIIRSLIKKFF